jgi:hypothetical protein
LVSGMAKVVRVRFWPGFRYLPAAGGRGKERKKVGVCNVYRFRALFCLFYYVYSKQFVFVPSGVMFLFLEACCTNDIEGTAYLQNSTLSLCDFST